MKSQFMQDFMRKTQYKDKYLDRHLKINEMIRTFNFDSQANAKNLMSSMVKSYRQKNDQSQMNEKITTPAVTNRGNNLKIIIGDESLFKKKKIKLYSTIRLSSMNTSYRSSLGSREE